MVRALRRVMRYGLESPWSSFRDSEFLIEGLSDSLIDFLKPLMASPRDLPNSGSLLGPKTTRATTKITISSGIPRLPNMHHLLDGENITLRFGVRDVNLVMGVGIWPATSGIPGVIMGSQS
jgi:hypothetical protein